MTGRLARVVEAGYVATVGALTARAFSDPVHEHWGAEIAAAVLGLPLVIVALPLIYVLGAVAWNLSDAGAGGPMWPVTMTFTALMTAVACGNVLLFRRIPRISGRTSTSQGLQRLRGDRSP